MTTPMNPEMCQKTGRLLTEWFEFKEWDHELATQAACEEFGVDEPPGVRVNDTANPNHELQVKFNAFINRRLGGKWGGGITKQEVAHRLNEATKMVDPTNFKFLDKETRDRTGLEINPLWMIECIVRAGVLSPKEQIAALKELAAYTHSKAPSINHSTVTNMKPEDWLLELAKEDYKEVEILQPKQPIEYGTGPDFDRRERTRLRDAHQLLQYNEKELDEMMKEVDEINLEDFTWEEPEEDG